MSGILFVDAAKVEATSGQMLITFGSGGDAFRFHLPPHIALRFRTSLFRDGWQIVCAPDAEVVELRPKKGRKKGGRS